jgi:hypothetical protein
MYRKRAERKNPPPQQQSARTIRALFSRIQASVAPQNGKPDVPQHLVIENAPLGAADQNRCALIGNVATAILKALETYAIENILQIGDLLRRQLCANPFKSCIRQGSSS